VQHKTKKTLTLGILTLFLFLSLFSLSPYYKQYSPFLTTHASGGLIQQATGNTGTTTLAIAFGSSVTSGDIVVVTAEGNYAVSSVTDTLSTSYSAYTAGGRVNTFAGKLTSSGSDTVTITWSGAGTYYANIQEISGFNLPTNANNLSSTDLAVLCNGTGTLSSCSFGGNVQSGYLVANIWSNGGGNPTVTSGFTILNGEGSGWGAEYQITSGASNPNAAFGGIGSTWYEGYVDFPSILTCNPATLICVTLNLSADSTATAVTSTNYFTATISNGTTFHFYTNQTSASYASGQTITLSATTQLSNSTVQWCWSITTGTCNSIVINVGSTDGYFTDTNYYYELTHQNLSYEIKSGSTVVSTSGWTVPNINYTTAPSSAGSTDSPLTVNYQLTTTSTATWINIGTEPSYTLAISNSTYNAFLDFTPATLTTFNQIENPMIYKAYAFGNTPSITADSSCTRSNMGNNYNYYDMCGVTSGAWYDKENGATYGDSFTTYEGTLIAVSPGELVIWESSLGECFANTIGTGNGIVPINVTMTKQISGGYCEGVIDPSTITQYFVIVWQISYAQDGNVQTFTTSGISITESVSLVSTSSVTNNQFVFSPVSSGSVSLAFGISSGCPGSCSYNTFTANSPYSQLISQGVGSGSGSASNYNIMSAWGTPLTTQSSPFTVGGICSGCGTSAAIILWQPVDTIITFSQTGLPASTSGVLVINGVTYNVNNLPIMIPAPASITYGYFSSVGSYNWQSLSGCGSTFKDATITPSTSCTITAVYALGTTKQDNFVTPSLNQVVAYMKWIFPSLILIFGLLWLGIKLNLGAMMILILEMVGMVIVGIAGMLWLGAFTPLWISVISIIFMIVLLIAGAGRNN
jgi:hypothetical protein